MNNIYRHGDLSFRPFEGSTEELIEVQHQGSFILALGEHTGHKHVITAEPETMRIFQDIDGNYVLEVTSGAKLTHEEHKPISFAPGKYLMRQEQEFDYFLNEVAKVQD